jgi:ketosteroid isomerase-like protein
MDGSVSAADAIFKAIEAGDIEGVRDVYAPDAVIWHNFDQVEQSVEDNLRVLGWMVHTFAERSYEEVVRHEWDEGFVQQHVLRLTKQDGTKVELPCCIVAKVADGKITRIDEYLDSAQAAALAG